LRSDPQAVSFSGNGQYAGEPGDYGASRTSRTLRERAAAVNGFCRKGMPSAWTPRRKMASSV